MKRFSLLFIISCSLLLAILCVLLVRYNQNEQNNEILVNEQNSETLANEQINEILVNEQENVIITTEELKDYGYVEFEDTSGIERILAFLNNSGDIAFDIPKNYEFEKTYIYGPVNIKGIVLTGCVGESFFNDDNFKQYLDDNIECEGRLRRGGKIDEMRGYSLTIPGGIYKAYIPKNQTITHCSITNPIVCWNEDINKDEVLEYYYKHNECPSGFGYFLPGVSGPTAYCYVYQRYCYDTTCDYVERDGKKNVWACDLDERIWCGYRDGPMIPIGDPCDFYRGIGILPADGSCG